MLRAVGFGDGDFEKPIVGVANGHSTMNPCNAGIQPLVDRAMDALKSAGAMPQVFGFPTVTDGIGMGTEGMKYSLVSREVIADAIEVAVSGQCMDGVVCVGGCDKNMPGAMMAMARINVPGIFVYAGTIKPGYWKGEMLTIVSPFEAVGAYSAGKMAKEDFEGIEKNACPSVGACGGQYTANTMSSSFEALGMSLLGSSQMASPDPEKADSAAASARALVNAVKTDLKPRDIITRNAIENAIALVMATGGSTNAVLHYLAIAAAAGVARGCNGQEDQAGRRDRQPIGRTQRGSRHAGNARSDLGVDRAGVGRVGGSRHRWAFLRWHLGHGRRSRGSRGVRRRKHRSDRGRRSDHDRCPQAARRAQRERRGTLAASRALEAAGAKVHAWRAGQIHEARVDGEHRRDHRSRHMTVRMTRWRSLVYDMKARWPGHAGHAKKAAG